MFGQYIRSLLDDSKISKKENDSVYEKSIQTIVNLFQMR